MVDRLGDSTFVGLRDFARAMENRPQLNSLVTVGHLGCIVVFRDADCAEDKGYIVIGTTSKEGEGAIRIGFFRDANYDPAKFVRLGDAFSAAEYFERCLVERGFVD